MLLGFLTEKFSLNEALEEPGCAKDALCCLLAPALLCQSVGIPWEEWWLWQLQQRIPAQRQSCAVNPPLEISCLGISLGATLHDEEISVHHSLLSTSAPCRILMTCVLSLFPSQSVQIFQL